MNKKIRNIYIKFNSDLLKFIKSKIDNKQDAEDILQNVYIKIDKSLGKLNDESKIKSWIFTITRNTIFDFYKKKQKHPYELNDDILNVIEKDDNNNYLSEMTGCISHMLKELPGNYSEALKIVYLEWKSQKELSEKLWISIPWAKSRIQRGRRILKENFIKCCKPEYNKNWNIIDLHKKKCTKC